jgi:single-strand DNA-binding protein
MGLNKHELIGRLGADPKFLVGAKSGRVFATLRVGTTEKWRDRQGQARKHTEWHNAVCWGARAEAAVRFLRRGAEVYLAGPSRSREFVDSGGARRVVREIHIREMVFLGSKPKYQEDTEVGDEALPTADELLDLWGDFKPASPDDD